MNEHVRVPLSQGYSHHLESQERSRFRGQGFLPRYVNSHRPPCGERLDREPAPQSTGLKGGEIPAKQEEVTSMSFGIEQGWRIPCKVAVVGATTTTTK